MVLSLVCYFKGKLNWSYFKGIFFFFGFIAFDKELRFIGELGFVCEVLYCFLIHFWELTVNLSMRGYLFGDFNAFKGLDFRWNC